ncbi:MAG: hypothetical protein ACE5GJ_10925 [Gemmatimonadota bacterium]
MSSPDPRALTDARLQLHYAVQLIPVFGRSYVAARDDDSHRSMTWDPDRRSFLSQPSDSSVSGVRVHIAPRHLTASVRQDGEERASFSLVGLTPGEAMARLADVLSPLFGPDAQDLEWPEYELPDHPLAHGGRFTGTPQDHFADLEERYDQAAALLGELAAAEPHATPVRCWPHHFDIARLLLLDPELGAGEGRSVGVGMSPGDGGYPEPYWYVTPYPYPEAEELPPLPPGGHWHQEGWFGAVLTATAAAEAEAHARDVTRAFLTQAVAANRALLEEGS